MSPCGGIYPIKDSWLEPLVSCGECFLCNLDTNTTDLWIEEWDAPLHRNCLETFMKTEEGQIIIKHGHSVVTV